MPLLWGPSGQCGGTAGCGDGARGGGDKLVACVVRWSAGGVQVECRWSAR